MRSRLQLRNRAPRSYVVSRKPPPRNARLTICVGHAIVRAAEKSTFLPQPHRVSGWWRTYAVRPGTLTTGIHNQSDDCNVSNSTD